MIRILIMCMTCQFCHMPRVVLTDHEVEQVDGLVP